MERNSIDEKLRRKPSGAAVMRTDLTDALYRAFFEEWAEHGYTGLSLERVAARAGAGKAAIYRRWPSKLAIASEAVEKLGLTLTEVSDRGGLAEEIEAYLLMMRRALRHRLVRRILPDIYAEGARSSELAPLMDKLSAVRRDAGGAIVDRAIERGELKKDMDRELALDMIPSALYWRMVILRRRASREQIGKQVKALVAGLTAY
jgi:AcrR family transcriptional regulator